MTDEKTEITFGAVVIVLSVAVGLGVYGAGRRSEARPRPSVGRHGIEGVPDFGEPAGAAELALLAPLGEGAVLQGWTIEAIDAVENGVIVVHAEREGSRMSLPIGLTAGSRFAPPVTAGPYGIFATHFYGALADGDEGMMLAQGLASFLLAHAEEPPPPGMTAYTPSDAAPDPE